MSGDYTRFSFNPSKRYSGVWMQQGRVQLDADWNEGVDILKDRVRKLSLDAFGRVGVPFLVAPDAFAIGVLAGPPLDLSIGAGRIYVDGYMAENFTPPATYLMQPFLPDPPPLPAGDVIVALDLWEREVTYIEEPALLDVALGGVDTSTRIQQVWQVRVVAAPDGQNAQCGVDLAALFPPSAGRLTTEAIAPPTPDDPCILPPIAGYRGLENRLYRLEIHNGGPMGVARFKWSRDNGSIVSAVSAIAVGGGQTRLNVHRLGRDKVLRFRIDDWVTVTDEHRELHGEPGEMARIVDIDETVPAIVLDRPLPSPGQRAFGAAPADLIARRTRVQLWNQNAAVNVLDADGLMTTGAGPIDIEDGIRVRFNVDPAGGSFRAGDCWEFAARTADASVELLTQAPPRAIIHHYAQLAAINGLGGANDVSDCRPTRDECACCCVVNVAPPGEPGGDFHSIKDALAALPVLAGPDTAVLVCLLRGEHPVDDVIALDRPLVTIRGCGLASVVRPKGGFIAMSGMMQALEDFAIQAETDQPVIVFEGGQQRAQRLWARNRGPGPIAFARKVVDLTIADCELRGVGGVDLTGVGLNVERNHLVSGPVAIGSPSMDVRIRDNRLQRSQDHGVLLHGESAIETLEIDHNRIERARGSGVGVTGDLGPLLAGVLIARNEIVDCVDPNFNKSALPYGGVALGRAMDLIVRDNRIADNGVDVFEAVCGIYVHRSFGVEIARNLIAGNGPPAGEKAIAGPQAGVYLASAKIGIGFAPDPADPDTPHAVVGAIPAARIADNDIDAPRGHALVVLGTGPMPVVNNRLQCRDIIGRTKQHETPLNAALNFVGAAVVVNFGLPSWLYAFLLSLGFAKVEDWANVKVSGFSLSNNSLVGGQTQFRGNQVRLDLSQAQAEVALANILLVSLDDVQCVDNQSEGVLRFAPGQFSPAPTAFDFLAADLLAFAITLRQADNGLFTTPYLTAFSILSRALVNHCLGNQTTSCISAVGGAPKSKRRDNAILFPHPLFCSDAGHGED